MSTSPSQPSFTFTIPSIHDDIDLNCRIYNPPYSKLFSPVHDSPWNPRGAVVAHAYAPLGGCYDDLIVLAVVEECLKKGLVVGTFNFRGVAGSKSTTSWSGKSELNDYISFAGLLIHYIQTLARTPSPFQSPSRALTDAHLTPVPSNTTPPTHLSVPQSPISLSQQHLHILLAGYSYGSLITTTLPPTTQIFQGFAAPRPGSARAEILARAHSLAVQTLKDFQTSDDARRGRCQIFMGGEEGEPGSRRMSRDNSRRSIDAVRKSVEITRRSIERSGRRLLRKSSNNNNNNNNNNGKSDGGFGIESYEETSDGPAAAAAAAAVVVADQTLPPPPSSKSPTPEIETSYLLISPLLGPMASLAKMSLSTLFHSQSPPTILSANPTFVIYGAGDIFTSAKRLRKWCAALQGQAGGRFAWREVGGAGHFWREDGVEEVLREGVGDWIEKVMARGVER